MWPKIPSGFVRSVLAGHSALGLFFAALLYMVCLSGTITVFRAEIQQWEQPGVAAGRAAPEAVERALGDIYKLKSDQHGEALHSVAVFNNPDREPRPIATWSVDGGEFGARYVDLKTGALLEETHTPFAEYLENLHVHLRLPSPWGIYLVGLIGVAMLSLVVSGLLAHPRIFKDAFHLRRGGSMRLQEADLHNRMSVWALPFHLTISFTGAFLGLSFFIVGILAFIAYDGDQEAAVRAILGPQATEDHDPRPLPGGSSMFADAQARTGLSQVNYVLAEHPGTAGQILTVEMNAPRDLSTGEVLYYDAEGTFIEASGSAFGSFGPQTVAAMGPLHFGWFGGLATKLAYLVFGLASTLVASTGVSIWLARRREQGRPTPVWERVWTTAAWGGALACAAPGLFAPLGEAWFNPVLILCLAVSLALAFTLKSPRAVSRTLRSALAAALAALAAQNIWLNGGAALQGAPLAVNLALLALAAAMVSSLVMGEDAQEAAAPA